MELKTLLDKLNEHAEILVSPISYKRILNRGNNLLRFDVINRILIDIQYHNAFDIRTEQEWFIQGKEVKNGSKPIYVVTPKYKTVYIDNKTGTDVSNDLNIEEIKKALEYNLIHKQESVDSLGLNKTYELRQTNSIENISKPILNKQELINIFIKLTDCTIEVCDDTYYSKSSNHLFLKDCEYKELVNVISEIMSLYEIDNNLDITNLSNTEVKILKDSINYSINTLFAGTYNEQFDSLCELTYSQVINILYIVDEIIYKIINEMNFTDENFIGDAYHNIEKVKRAEYLLNIMESAYAIKNLIN